MCDDPGVEGGGGQMGTGNNGDLMQRYTYTKLYCTDNQPHAKPHISSNPPQNTPSSHSTPTNTKKEKKKSFAGNSKTSLTIC